MRMMAVHVYGHLIINVMIYQQLNIYACYDYFPFKFYPALIKYIL